ncbi:MAG: hypothetical protein GX601_07610 [Anaerolineales bacterium]|nr:hypothetical protein [Anaerolineales bacterium]
MTTAASREVAVRSIADHIARQKRLGTSEELIEQWTPRSIDVVCAQLSNIPVDMIIEQWLYERYEELHPSQFVSLFAMHSDAARTLNDTQIKEITAPVIYRATVSLNHAFDLFIDRLFGHRTDYATVYRRVPDASAGSKIFAAWQRAMRNYAPGDEFRLVDEVAKLLGLDRWYVWREDVGERDTAEAAGPQGPTNLEALEERDPAVVMYCLDALERFEGMDDAAVFAIGSEIALKAQGGLDYTDPERKHTLQSLKGEQFSGLHLLCLMYVAFQRVNPSLDLQLPFADAYQRALGMFGKRQ